MLAAQAGLLGRLPLAFFDDELDSHTDAGTDADPVRIFFFLKGGGKRRAGPKR